ncbi:MAG: CDP-glucose 4,6-dehydratase [Candidatus Accumulibacter sp.]|jgi:CDP-glucose 4,6-dehydratase|nr:CDP-glucose 4,6-dehydratase [Accumulibacter sp.]
MTAPNFWRGKRVLLTGHTGFKGSWLALRLNHLGAELTGFALAPPTRPSLFEIARAGEGMRSIIADIRDAAAIHAAVAEAQPEVIFHLAAQPLIRQAYADPAATYATNVMGLVNLLEAVRRCDAVRVLVNVTSDKCYENREWFWGYREHDRLGGRDPYSSSKACAELVTAAYRDSYLGDGNMERRAPVAVATARAGNVIGGGDWAKDRLVPDILDALDADRPVIIRHPQAVRSWQHVLEPLSGYLLLAEALWREGPAHTGAWNFGPADEDARPVRWLVEKLAQHWPGRLRWEIDNGPHPHEACQLRPDCSKARIQLGWRPRWNLETALARIAAWHQAYLEGRQDMRAVTLEEIRNHAAE